MVELYFKYSVIHWGDLCLSSSHIIADFFKAYYLKCTVKDKKWRSQLSIKSCKLIDRFGASISYSHPERTSLQRKLIIS